MLVIPLMFSTSLLLKMPNNTAVYPKLFTIQVETITCEIVIKSDPIIKTKPQSLLRYPFNWKLHIETVDTLVDLHQTPTDINVAELIYSPGHYKQPLGQAGVKTQAIDYTFLNINIEIHSSKRRGIQLWRTIWQHWR